MEDGEETRKIQFTGKSSYIVSLPKQWIMELGLKQGDQIRMVRKGSSTLELFPPKFESRTQKKEDAIIEIEGEEESSSIARKLISLYFLGFKTINVKPKNGRLSAIQRNTVKESVKRMLMGSEIIADSSGGITVQVLVNLLELSVDGAFKRMIHLAKSMSSDAILAVKENNLELREKASKQESQRAKEYAQKYLEQLNRLIENAKKQGVSDEIIKNLESARENLSSTDNPREIIKEIRKIMSLKDQFDLTKHDRLESRILQVEKTLSRLSQADGVDEDTISDVRDTLQKIKQKLKDGEFETANELLRDLTKQLAEIKNNF